MNWQSQYSALQTTSSSPTDPKGAVVLVDSEKKNKNKRGGGSRGKVQKINLEMSNHFMLFLHFPPSCFDLSSN